MENNNDVYKKKMKEAEDSLENWKITKSKLEKELERATREIFIHEGYISAYSEILENEEENSA